MVISGDLYWEFDRKYHRTDRVCCIVFIPVKPLITCRMIFKSRLGSEHDKIKNSNTTEKQQRALCIAKRRKCERVRRTGSDKNKVVEDCRTGRIKDVVIGTEGGEQQKAEKRRMRIAV